MNEKTTKHSDQAIEQTQHNKKNGKSRSQTKERQRQTADSEISILKRRSPYPEMKLPQGKARDPGPQVSADRQREIPT